MIRRPPRSPLSSSSAASDVYKRQVSTQSTGATWFEMAQQLSAYNRVPDVVRSHVLLLGHVDAAQKNQLAMQLLGQRDSDTLREIIVRKCTSLPLPEDPERPRIDYVGFMLDMRSQESLNVLQHNLQNVGLDYFHGRSCIITCNGAVDTSLAFRRSELTRIAREYELVVVNASFEKSNSHGAAQVAAELSTRIAIACREHSHISPLLLVPPYIGQRSA
eukprot:TRINITY_DN50113_c0_g1_i1.p1 TRINITY_DN50113_c0_g1~~TRINITY_DN50113_c0_g1_i1.p1  ORF type:complete len:218 (+),score=51.01 TRINITY_DN50113_c0_g1_i1:63-716(+)